MSEENEYGYTSEDAKGGGGGGKAKPANVYETVIEDASIEKDKNGKLYVKAKLRISSGPLKKQVLFENYLPLSKLGSKFQVARRNSFVKALGLKEGASIPGTPGAPDVSTINGTTVDIQSELEYENVPGQEYSVTTRRGKLPDDVTEADIAGIQPREALTWYNLSDGFDGIGGESGGSGDSGSSDEDSWG